MPPVNSNHGGNLTYLEDATVEKKGFQITPILYSYHIINLREVKLGGALG